MKLQNHIVPTLGNNPYILAMSVEGSLHVWSIAWLTEVSEMEETVKREIHDDIRILQGIVINNLRLSINSSYQLSRHQNYKS